MSNIDIEEGMFLRSWCLIVVVVVLVVVVVDVVTATATGASLQDNIETQNGRGYWR